MKWFIIILALIYLLSPLDLLPGLNPAGWLDDIVVLVLLYRYLSRSRQSGQAKQPPFGKNQQQHNQSETKAGESFDKTNRTPHDILGVPTTADQKEIRTAYRDLANQYHPDKVSHLGKEFQKLAEERFKEIQQAYDKLTHT